MPVVRSGLGSPPNRSIFLDNVVCTGGESNLTECGHTTISNCDRSEEAGVRCEGIFTSIIIIYKNTFFYISAASCREGDVRLGIGNFTEFYISINNYDDFYFIKDELARGRIEVCINGIYGTICDENWVNEDASVVCSQLGFSRYGVLPTQ